MEVPLTPSLRVIIALFAGLVVVIILLLLLKEKALIC